jgi:hypothetical protein
MDLGSEIRPFLMEPIERFPVVPLPGAGEGEFALPFGEAGQVQQGSTASSILSVLGFITALKARRSKAATELREAFGVRGACSRFRPAPRLTTAPASWTHSKRFARQFIYNSPAWDRRSSKGKWSHAGETSARDRKSGCIGSLHTFWVLHTFSCSQLLTPNNLPLHPAPDPLFSKPKVESLVRLTHMILGLNATKEAIFVAETQGEGLKFLASKVQRIQFQIQQPSDLTDLLQTISTILDHSPGVVQSIAILKCSGGQYGSSVEAIKAEAIAELVAVQKGLKIIQVTPQSLKKALSCPAGQKWQDRAKELFNADGRHKYWSQGANGAVSAAFKAASN